MLQIYPKEEVCFIILYTYYLLYINIFCLLFIYCLYLIYYPLFFFLFLPFFYNSLTHEQIMEKLGETTPVVPSGMSFQPSLCSLSLSLSILFPLFYILLLFFFFSSLFHYIITVLASFCWFIIAVVGLAEEYVKTKNGVHVLLLVSPFPLLLFPFSIVCFYLFWCVLFVYLNISLMIFKKVKAGKKPASFSHICNDSRLLWHVGDHKISTMVCTPFFFLPSSLFLPLPLPLSPYSHNT